MGDVALEVPLRPFALGRRREGDDARDASYYTKRSLLAAVWTSTFLYWLEDRSEGCGETWSFLERCIANVMQIGQLRARIDEFFQSFGRLNPLAHRR